MSVTQEASHGIMNLMRPLMAAANEHLESLPAAHQTVIADFLDAAQHLMRDHLHTLSEKDPR
ncbi:hypothetical protein D3C76_1809280 [compost metagenome]